MIFIHCQIFSTALLSSVSTKRCCSLYTVDQFIITPYSLYFYFHGKSASVCHLGTRDSAFFNTESTFNTNLWLASFEWKPEMSVVWDTRCEFCTFFPIKMTYTFFIIIIPSLLLIHKSWGLNIMSSIYMLSLLSLWKWYSFLL